MTLFVNELLGILASEKSPVPELYAIPVAVLALNKPRTTASVTCVNVNSPVEEEYDRLPKPVAGAGLAVVRLID